MPTLHDSVLDAPSTVISAANLMTLCNAQPTTRTEAVTTFALADVAMVGGDFTTANGDVSGRKTVVAAKTGVPVDATGTATHVALVDATNLLAENTLSASQALTSGNNVDIGSWRIEFLDPVAV
ncbi:hypothetical protein [Neptunomonas sp.]|uniref:hypothetical protein n=1 Tax=Neptunomonas sp. TaxID=1971898 RepID=UPI003565F261